MPDTPAWTTEYHTAGDGYRWHYRRYRPDRPRARVVCLHGIQSHAGWYDGSSRRLRDRGYEVLFLERRGSGENQVARGDAPSFRRLLDDIAEFLGTLPRDRPVFLQAVSWGGKLAAALQRRHPGLVDGLMLLCPGFIAKVRPSRREQLNILWSRVWSPTRRFPVPLTEPSYFTANPAWQSFLRDDPLLLREATSRFLVESVRLDAYLSVVPPAVTVPVLLQLAELDRVIDNTGTRRYVERFASRDRTMIEYPGAHHTLEFEPPPHRYFEDLSGWLDAHIK